MLKLDIQRFADGKVVIETELNTKNFENGLDKMKNTSQNAGNSIKNIVAGLGITKLIGVAMNQINSSLDGAVSRLDTLNNFPKVMSNLGIGAEEAEDSIKKMGERLAGLPTTLDEAALSVQRLTAKNGDVAKSTDLFLALNNAILAGGAGTQIQSNALEQLSQAYSKGKMDMMEWRTIQIAMPAQLNQIAKAMGVTTDELGVMLREADDGGETMERFMETIAALNEEGIDGFQNFEQQARNSTGGIKTAITVAKTQIVKGVADIIQSLNKGLEEADLPNITEIIQNIGKGAKQVLDVVADKLPAIISFLKTIAPILVPIIAGVTAFKIIGTIIALINGAKTAILALNVAMAANPIGVVIGLITALVATFTYLWNTSEDFRNFWIGLWEGIKNVTNVAINFIVTKIQSFVAKIVAIFNIGKQIYEIGKNILSGLWKGIQSKWGDFKNNIENLGTGIVKKFKSVFGIKSPSRVFRDEIGKFLAEGMGVGFEDELDSVYKDMQRAIDVEQGKLVASVETGRVFNTIQNSTPVVINLNADVDLDGQMVGRLITPEISRTIKSGGGL